MKFIFLIFMVLYCLRSEGTPAQENQKYNGRGNPIQLLTNDEVTTPDMQVSSSLSVETTTTNNDYYCPGVYACTGCPDGWQHPPEFIEQDYQIEDDLCDVVLSWDPQPSIDGSPLLSFNCIYESNDQYCHELAIPACASCGNVTITGLNTTLLPYISYSDSCEISSSFAIGENCFEAVTTTNPEVPFCPDVTQCFGCPEEGWAPDLQLSGSTINNGTCNITVTWDWDFSSNDNVDNPTMEFQCIYRETGFYCDTNFLSACGSCEEVVFENVEIDQNPYINFGDTCGNIIRINVPFNICPSPD